MLLVSLTFGKSFNFTPTPRRMWLSLYSPPNLTSLALVMWMVLLRIISLKVKVSNCTQLLSSNSTSYPCGYPQKVSYNFSVFHVSIPQLRFVLFVQIQKLLYAVDYIESAIRKAARSEAHERLNRFVLSSGGAEDVAKFFVFHNPPFRFRYFCLRMMNAASLKTSASLPSPKYLFTRSRRSTFQPYSCMA